jgi:hypothetical protein
MKFPVWFMRLFRMNRPVLQEHEITPFLQFWPGEIVRHMGHMRPDTGAALAGCVTDAGRNFVCILWEGRALDERITDPAALAQILKQPRPAFSQL